MFKTTYPAIITGTATGFVVKVPQFNILEAAGSRAEAIQNAREAICARIAGIENTGGAAPIPATELSEAIDPDCQQILIDVDMVEYTAKHGSKAVRKNCTIPQWMDAEARKRNINFSQTLQNAILYQLGIN